MKILDFLLAFARNTYGGFLGLLATAHARMSKPTGDKYNLSHLTQGEGQYVIGPVQDDEALFLYSVVRTMRMRTILEVGGLSGFSALNFVRAIASPETDGVVITIDTNKVRKVADNHMTIQKPAGQVGENDLRPLLPANGVFDLVFFDAHHYEEQMALFEVLSAAKLVDDDTILAFHDTDLYPYPINIAGKFAKDETGKSGYQRPEERRMVRAFVETKQYGIFQLHTPHNRLQGKVKFRHGVTLLQKKRL